MMIKLSELRNLAEEEQWIKSMVRMCRGDRQR